MAGYGQWLCGHYSKVDSVGTNVKCNRRGQWYLADISLLSEAIFCLNCISIFLVARSICPVCMLPVWVSHKKICNKFEVFCIADYWVERNYFYGVLIYKGYKLMGQYYGNELCTISSSKSETGEDCKMCNPLLKKNCTCHGRCISCHAMFGINMVYFTANIILPLIAGFTSRGRDTLSKAGRVFGHFVTWKKNA